MSICQVRSENGQDGAMAVTNFINSKTTPEEFEAFRANYPKFQIHYGGRCGWNVFCSSARRGNAKLLAYLLETYGTMFANVGNEFGWTPIFCATTCEDEDAAIECINVLLQFSADPTIQTSMSCMGEKRTEKGTSPFQNCVALKREKLIKRLQQPDLW